MKTIPEATFAELKDWIDNGTPPGYFLSAVLRNDLRGAIAYSKEKEFAALPKVLYYLVWDAPHNCWGSDKNVNLWAAKKNSERVFGVLTLPVIKTDWSAS